jgi:uncharacterized protein (TIGR02328 family)
MRLWHEDLLDKLPANQFNGQHREICALRGKGWEKNHSTVDYIFNYPIEHLIAYHFKYLSLRRERGYNYNEKWERATHRGKNLEPFINVNYQLIDTIIVTGRKCYPEHNEKYLKECIENLKEKGCVCRYYED